MPNIWQVPRVYSVICLSIRLNCVFSKPPCVLLLFPRVRTRLPPGNLQGTDTMGYCGMPFVVQSLLHAERNTCRSRSRGIPACLQEQEQTHTYAQQHASAFSTAAGAFLGKCHNQQTSASNLKRCRPPHEKGGQQERLGIVIV